MTEMAGEYEACERKQQVVVQRLIPTPVGNYSPDWAIAFYEGTAKHIFFIAETKGTMESMQLRPIEKAKISCARKLFNEISTENVVYHDVDSYQSLLDIMPSIEKKKAVGGV